jgi:parallel beta-helix repeat protein
MHETLACLALVVLVSVSSAQDGTARLYVSPEGDDAANGRSPETAFATLTRAQLAVRLLKAAGLTQPVEVILQGGTHFLAEPLVLTPEDSGTADCPITYRAAEGEEAVLSGGMPVTGWSRRADGLWTAPLPGVNRGGFVFRLLRVGEAWGRRARHPNYDPAQPYTGGWLFADYGGETWERGTMGSGVQNTHNVGDTLTWRVRFPADGEYRVWLRYGHHMSAYDRPEMGGASALRLDDGEFVPLENLPDTGSWDASRWAPVCRLTISAGEHILTWRNLKGGGINLDAFAYSTDEAWDPNEAMSQPTWWGAVGFQDPAPGTHALIVQAEACDTAEGPEIQVSRPAPPGTVSHLRYREGDVPTWADTAGAEVHVFIAWGWVNAIVPVDRIEPDDRRLVFAGAGAAQDVRVGNRYFIENVREALDAPGEWLADAATGELLHLPERETFADGPVVAPVLDRLVVLQGDPENDRFVEHVRFEGLTFTDTTYNLTDQYYHPQDACVWMGGARECAVENCEFRWLGGYAVKLLDRSTQCTVRRNRMHDLGQGGVITVGGTAEQSHHCAILGNTMERLGLIYKHVAGVYVTHGSDHRIAHNRITEVPRYGISLKSQGEDRLSHRNVVEYNEIRRCNLETNDTGGFESLGYEHRDSGNIVRHNLIVDSVGLLTTPEGQILTPHFTWGVYLDDYSSGTTVFGNVVVRTTHGGVCIHGGQNNDIRNNIFIEGETHQVRLQPRDDFMQGNSFVNNIIVYSNPDADLIFAWRNQAGMFGEADRNLYWLQGSDLRTLEKRLTFAGTWAEWLAAGYDAHSVVADPLFVDLEHEDFRLLPDSPALALGFQPIPFDKIGPEGLDE